MTDLRIDPDSIDRAASELQDVADDLDTAVSGFVQALRQYGDPWGMDMLGMLIGGGYVAIEQLALETLGTIVDSFDGDAEALSAVAASYRGTEEANTDAFTNLHRGR